MSQDRSLKDEFYTNKTAYFTATIFQAYLFNNPEIMKNFDIATATDAVKHDVFSFAVTFLYLLGIVDKKDLMED